MYLVLTVGLTPNQTTAAMWSLSEPPEHRSGRWIRQHLVSIIYAKFGAVNLSYKGNSAVQETTLHYFLYSPLNPSRRVLY
jgi:hypothetical protein